MNHNIFFDLFKHQGVNSKQDLSLTLFAAWGQNAAFWFFEPPSPPKRVFLGSFYVEQFISVIFPPTPLSFQ